MSPTSTEEPSSEPPLFTRSFALILATQLAFGFSFSSFFLLPKFVVTELAGTPSEVGLVGALAVLAAVLVSPLCGKLLDRGKRRPLILIGCVFSGLAALPYIAVQQVGPLVYGLRLAQGVSYTLYFVGITTLVADLAPPRRLGQALGWIGCAGLVMNAVATVVAEHIASAHGWHAVFITACGFGLLGAVLSVRLPEPEYMTASKPLVGSKSASLHRFTVLWAAAAGGAGFGALFTFTQPLALSLGDTNVSPLFAGYTLAALFVRLAFGNLSDRLGRARVGSVALGLYAMVVASAAVLARGWLGPLGVGFGLAHGAFYPALNALALEGVTREARGTVGAYFNAAFNAGVLVVTFGFGQLAEAHGYRTVFLLVAALTATGGFALARQVRGARLARAS